ncbi:type II secretion protein F [Enemella evansiae]|uniref:Type II secretion protein F n=1 Tax=Enemella evansiae TaxID=2016499 RepID=A0A255GNG3_9ACTN|nr:type II secretion system F family protein [Enemella evansiae]OYO16106.1 type II secretion protein F [Enemella evansiae]
MVTVALLLAALAAVLFVDAPAPRRLLPSRAGPRGPRWLSPRPGALPGRTRWLLGAAAGIAVTGFLPGLWPVLVLPLVAAMVAVGLGRFESPAVVRARQQRVRELPQLLELLAGCLAAGLPLRAATRIVAQEQPGPLGADLHRVLACLDVGGSEREAWALLAEDPCWRSVARDVGRAAESGSELGALLARHSERARQERAAQAQQRARTLGVRGAFPMAVCFLPAFVLIGMVPIVGSIVARVLGP